MGEKINRRNAEIQRENILKEWSLIEFLIFLFLKTG